MRIGDSFPSKYLKASDLPDGQFVRVQIDFVEMQNVAGNDQPDETKPVLHFVGKEKGIVLNRTNAQEISNAYGDETDEWNGKPLLLYSTTTSFQGKNVPCIRVKVPKPGKTATAPQPPRAAAAPAEKPPVPAQPPAGEYRGEAGPGIPSDDIPFAPCY